MKQTALFLFSLVMMTACDSWDAGFDASEKGLISSIENEAHEKIVEFSYTNDGFLKKSKEMNTLYTEGKKAEYAFTFNDEGLLTQKKGFQPGNMMMSSIWGAMDKEITVEFDYYDDQRLKSIRTFTEFEEDFEDNNFETYELVEYSGDTVFVTRNFVEVATNSLLTYTAYIFDADDNITETLYYYTVDNQQRITTRIERTFDDKKAPFSFDPLPQSKSNPLTQITTSYNYSDEGEQQMGYTSEYTYEYEYNNLDFPTMKKETWPNETINITYYNYR